MSDKERCLYCGYCPHCGRSDKPALSPWSPPQPLLSRWRCACGAWVYSLQYHVCHYTGVWSTWSYSGIAGNAITITNDGVI